MIIEALMRELPDAEVLPRINLTPDLLLALVWRARPVIAKLMKDNALMTYGDFAGEIGLIADGEYFNQNHAQKVTVVLCFSAALDHQCSGTTPLEYERIVTARTNKPGAGVKLTSRIVRG